jgi:hypothetical protein
MIEWHPPVDLFHDTSPVFARITKSVGDRPVYSYHFLKRLNNDASSKHLPVSYDAKTLKVRADDSVFEDLRKQILEYIEADLKSSAPR